MGVLSDVHFLSVEIRNTCRPIMRTIADVEAGNQEITDVHMARLKGQVLAYERVLERLYAISERGSNAV